MHPKFDVWRRDMTLIQRIVADWVLWYFKHEITLMWHRKLVSISLTFPSLSIKSKRWIYNEIITLTVTNTSSEQDFTLPLMQRRGQQGERNKFSLQTFCISIVTSVVLATSQFIFMTFHHHLKYSTLFIVARHTHSCTLLPEHMHDGLCMH